mmetsp:Transcript_73688/g.239980  ORF Transcript_73688/g.239980 Transcript_73688/m.239980 type:complete len:218 (-) Transcript_73688:1005-1658(-)
MPAACTRRHPRGGRARRLPDARGAVAGGPAGARRGRHHGAHAAAVLAAHGEEGAGGHRRAVDELRPLRIRRHGTARWRGAALECRLHRRRAHKDLARGLGHATRLDLLLRLLHGRNRLWCMRPPLGSRGRRIVFAHRTAASASNLRGRANGDTRHLLAIPELVPYHCRRWHWRRVARPGSDGSQRAAVRHRPRRNPCRVPSNGLCLGRGAPAKQASE